MQLTAVLLLAALAQGALFTSKDVRVLAGKDFHRLVKGSDKLTVAAFVAPWCGYCKKLAPEYSKAATNLKGLANLVSVDCDEEGNKQFCSEMGVKGFPTMKIFPGGSAPSRSYDGERTAEGIVDYVIANMPSFVKRVASVKELEALRHKSAAKPIALLFTKAAKVTPMFKSLSTSFHKTIDFYAARETVVGAEAMAKFGATQVPTLVAVQDGEVTVYSGELKLNAIRTFLKEVADAGPRASSRVEL